MRLPATNAAALVIAILAALVLGAALGSQYWGGLVPCALCLVERWPWRAVIALGLAGAVLPRRAARAALGLAVLVLLAGAALGFTHVGVEHGAWPSPLPECSAPRISGNTLAERLQSMPLRPSKPCDSPTYLVPGLPVSMAVMDLIAALALAAGTAIFLMQSRRSRR